MDMKVMINMSEIDRYWEIKLKDKNPEAKKSVELNVIIARTGYDAHTRPYQRYYLQKLKLYIPDVPEFAPLFLSTAEFQPFFWRKSGKKEVKVLLHNLKEGSIQSISLCKADLAFSHARIKLIGDEKPISQREALRMIRAGLIHEVVQNELIPKYSETWL